MSNVTLPLATIVDILTPPAEVTSVVDYGVYLRTLLKGTPQYVAPATKRPPGRPLKYGHPYIMETTWKAMQPALKEYLRDYADELVNSHGERPSEVAKDQTAVMDEEEAILDNGVVLNLPPFDGIKFNFPPSRQD